MGWERDRNLFKHLANSLTHSPQKWRELIKMNAFISRLKRIRLGQILTIVLASCLLFVSTACSGIAQATSPSVQANDPAKAYDVRHSGPESGMNKYSDVDPRQESTSAAAKAKGLKDSSERNLTKGSGNVVENAKRVADEGGENLKELGSNAKRVADEGGETLKELGSNAKREASKLPSKAQNAIEEAGDRAASQVNSQVNKVQGNLDEAADQAKRAAKTTVD
jgi:ElaB/YqjD/DUF883 family membrane-anchored ribosome-binding protein